MNQPYTTKVAVENYLLQTIDPSFVTQLDSWILAMSRWCDQFANRSLFDTASSIMLYDGDMTDITLIKDVIDISEVKMDGIVITDYLKYPQGKVYTSRIVLDGQYFSRGKQNISVTGIHAMSKVLPDDIKFACTVLVAGIINGSTIGSKKGSTEKIGGYSIAYKTDIEVSDFATAKQILSSYKRVAL